jgi:hypothetical protein
MELGDEFFRVLSGLIRNSQESFALRANLGWGQFSLSFAVGAFRIYDSRFVTKRTGKLWISESLRHWSATG